ncbi:hypothetical protein CKM354_000596600 [Cercospora kikuchii]|uniref:Cytochrome P450 n=1 Tax=Cercospora kikuchii TaxID=84275 RepID=A0A9P3FG19_9PEZI|nr:uncharacterized protein CKM354_000596600 [Cercospora kikuchii]GIZ42707.1 hypothetical protein CKM354_000596600 [Cercospora kikuchii]
MHMTNLRGILPRVQLKLFDQYGPVVRVGPRDLLFNSAQAMRDIHGTRKGRVQAMAKDERLYQKYGTEEDHILSTLSHDVHARQRKMLSAAFSERSVRDLEPMIISHTDKLVNGIRKLGVSGQQKVNMMMWLNYTTFDITGYLVFGESFGCLDDGKLHPWVAFVLDAAKAQVIMSALQQIPGANRVIPYLIPKKVMDNLEQHRTLTEQRLNQRLEEGPAADKVDLVGLLLRDGLSQSGGGIRSGEDHISKGELLANTAVLINAGAETSATTLSGAIFFLATCSPARVSRLATEVRTAFHTVSSINALQASHLPYLNAVLQETLRYYPPAADRAPRRTPPEGMIIDGHFIAGNTYVGVPHFAAYHSAANFHRPDEWIPERWLDEECAEFGCENDQRDVMQAFSLGTYGCLGINLAWAELRIILCRLVWEFEFELCAGQEKWMDEQKAYILWDKPGLWVNLKERNR